MTKNSIVARQTADQIVAMIVKSGTIFDLVEFADVITSEVQGALDHALSPPQDDRDSFGHWLSGFTDGEGHFRLRARTISRKGRNYFHQGIGFGIKLRIDDIGILQRIERFFECGYVYTQPNNKGKHPVASFEVSKIRELHEVVVPNFKRYPLRAKKLRDFEIWSEAVALAYGVHTFKGVPSGLKHGRKKWTDDAVSRAVELERLLREVREVRAQTEFLFESEPEVLESDPTKPLVDLDIDSVTIGGVKHALTKKKG